MKALRKEFWMEIRKSRARFLSIFLIVALGVAFFSGIQATSPDMRYSGDAYYDEQNLMDVKVVGTLGLTADDVEAVKAVDGVEDAEGAFSTDVTCGEGENQKVLHVESINEKVNTLLVTEGSLPEKSGEIFLDATFASTMKYKVGDTIELKEGGDSELLVTKKYTVTGLGNSPLYISFNRGNTTLGSGEVNGFAYVLPEDFDQDVYTQIYVVVHGAKGLISYTDGYDNLIDKIMDRLEGIADVRCEVRYDEIKSDAQEEIDDAQKKLDDGKAEAEEKLADAAQELEDGEKELEDGKKEYEDGVQQLADAKKELEDGKTELADAKQQVSDGWAQINSAKSQLSDGQAQIASAKQQVSSGWTEVNANQKKLDESRATLEKSQAEYDSGVKQVAAAKKTLEEKQAEIDSGKTQLSDGKKQIETTRTELNTQRQQCEDGLTQVEAGEKELAEGDAALAAAKEQLSSLASGRDQLQTQADAVSSQITELQGQQNSLTTQRDQLQAQIDAAAESGQDQTELISQRDQVQAQIDAAAAKIAELQAQADTLTPQLETLNTQVTAAQSQIDTNSAALETTRQQLVSTRSQLESSIAQIDAGLEELTKKETELAATEKQLTEGQSQIDSSKKELKKQEKKLKSAKTQLEEGQKQISEGQAQIDAAKQKLNSAQAEIDANTAKMASAQSEIDTNSVSLREAEQEIKDNEQKITDGEKEIKDNEQKLADAKKDLEDAEKELADGKQEYEDAKKEADDEIAENQQKLDDAKQELEDLAEPEWMVTDRNDLPEYSDYGDNADRIRNIGKVFPAIFFLVAALISLTTMTRMVEEERTQIGTMKALGYEKSAIAMKYLCYALIATVGGSIVGILIGEKILPYIIITAYGIMYHNVSDSLVMDYEFKFALIASVAAVVCTVGATLLACVRALRETPASLMRPPAPKEGKRVLIERMTFLWKHINFSWKSTLRNLFRYKKRLFMTIFGIAGSMGLMLVGYGIRDSINDIADKQYKDLQHFEANVIEDEDAADEERQKVAEFLEADDRVDNCLEVVYTKMSAPRKNGANLSLYVFVPKDLDGFAKNVTLRDRLTKEEYSLTDEGAAICEKTASLLGLSVGDTITIEKGGELYSVKVAVITENYMTHYVYMTPKVYEETFGEAPEYGDVLFTMKEEYKDQLETVGKEVLKCDGALSISYTSSLSAQLDRMLSTLDVVIIVLIVSAGMLAFVVLYNLNNINITERQRELATLKVLGFYDGEVSQYVFRENVLLTVVGVLCGAVFGIFLHRYVITTVEVDAVMFGRNIKMPSFLICGAITCGFSVAVNLVMHFKLKKIDMVESLKSVE